MPANPPMMALASKPNIQIAIALELRLNPAIIHPIIKTASGMPIPIAARLK
jgi:hypothetical protein